MIHGDLKIELPDCPYIFDITNLCSTFDADYKLIDKTAFELLLEDIFNTNPDLDKDTILNYLNMAENIATRRRDVFKNIKYYKIQQTVTDHPEYKISFHTNCYNNDNGQYIDTIYSTDLSWNILSLIGNVELIGVETVEFLDIPEDFITQVQDLPPLSDKSLASANFYRGSQVMGISKLARFKNDGIETQSDTFQNRLKNLNKQMGIITATDIMNNSKVIPKNKYDFVRSSIKIYRINGSILSFGPAQVGEMKLLFDSDKKQVSFVTICNHNGILTFTINTLILQESI